VVPVPMPVRATVNSLRTGCFAIEDRWERVRSWLCCICGCWGKCDGVTFVHPQGAFCGARTIAINTKNASSKPQLQLYTRSLRPGVEEKRRLQLLRDGGMRRVCVVYMFSRARAFP
jgi:hypothetical protein